MIVVKVELHSAVTGKVKLMGAALIDNQGVSDDGKRGDYRVRVGRKGHEWRNAARYVQRHGEVKNYPRISYSVWRLVIRALLSAFPEEKG